MKTNKNKKVVRLIFIVMILCLELMVYIFNPSIPISLGVFVLFYISTILAFRLFLGSWGKVVTSIEAIYLLVFFIYSIMASIQFRLDAGRQRMWYFTITEDSMSQTLNLYLQIFLFFVLLLFLFGHPKNNFEKITGQLSITKNATRMLIADVIAFACTLIFLYYMARNLNLLLISYVNFRRSMSFGGLQYVWLYMMSYTISFLSGVSLDHTFLLKRSNFFRLAIIILFWMSSVLIDRRHIIPVIISVFLMSISKKEKIEFKYIRRAAIIIAIMMVYAVVRLGLSVGKIPIQTLVYTMSGEFILTQYVTCYYIAHPVSNLMYGKTYIWYTITKMIPRVLYSGKPSDLSVTFYNEVIKRGSAFAFNPVAEGLINFGKFSVFITPIVIYLFMRIGIKIGKKEPLFYFIICAYSFDFFRGEFANCIFDVVFLYICVKFFSGIRMKRNVGQYNGT